jgi:hypothetical protein
LKRWLRAVPVDASVFAAAQPIYTAAPLFVGCADPLAARLALMPGAAEVLPPSPETLAPPPRPPAKPLKMRAASAGKYARRALERATERILGASARHPVILSEARGLARLVAAGLLPERDMREVIHAAAAAVGKTDTTEIDQLIAWAASRPSGTSPEAERG